MVTLSLVLCLCACTAHAQTWDEWFKQRKTQRKYLFKQIALLHTYLDHIQKGYAIVDKGLTAIHTISNGNFQLHSDFFTSLSKVNPHIANSAKVAEIITLHGYLVRDIRRMHDFSLNNTWLTPAEVRYIASVCAHMLYLVDACISELLIVIRSGSDNYKMKDDERISRINRLHDDTCDMHAFVRAFENDVRGMVIERKRNQQSIDQLIIQQNPDATS